MILPPLPMATSAAVTALVVAALALAYRVAFPRAARHAAARAVTSAFVAATAVLAAAHGAWALGLSHWPASYWGAVVATLALPALLLLVPAVTIAGEPSQQSVRVVPERDAEPPARAIGRRAFVAAATALAPVAALGAGGAALAGGARDPRLRAVRFAWPDLPAELAGLRMLQLSDLHLGCGRALDDLERALEGAASLRPDLVVVTGDVAEDVDLLAPALRSIAALRPRLGAFACLGNHEYLRDIRVTRPAFERGDVALLVDRAARVRCGAAELELVGLDDPVFVGRDVRPFLRERLARACDGGASGATRVLLSHRPEAFDLAEEADVRLVLSGHTHGGQVGFAGRSAFEPLYPDGYLGVRTRAGARASTRRAASATGTRCASAARASYRSSSSLKAR